MPLLYGWWMGIYMWLIMVVMSNIGSWLFSALEYFGVLTFFAKLSKFQTLTVFEIQVFEICIINTFSVFCIYI